MSSFTSSTATPVPLLRRGGIWRWSFVLHLVACGLAVSSFFFLSSSSDLLPPTPPRRPLNRPFHRHVYGKDQKSPRPNRRFHPLDDGSARDSTQAGALA